MTGFNWARSNKFTELVDNYPWRYGAIVLDTETTGLYSHRWIDENGEENEADEILQLSIISAGTGRTLYNKKFWPAHHKSWPEAQAVNHIRPIDVRDAPSFYEERPKIQEIINAARLIIGYNLDFDLSMLKAAGISFTKVKWGIDVMEDFSIHYGERVEWLEGYKWQRLTKAARVTGYDPYYWDPNLAGTGYDAHDSLNDCRATLHVAMWLQSNPDQMLKNAKYCY